MPSKTTNQSFQKPFECAVTAAPKRKGAIRRADVTRALKAKLDRGEVETVTLSECLVLNFAKLMAAGFPELTSQDLSLMKAAEKNGEGWVKKMKLSGEILQKAFGFDEAIYRRAIAHRADHIRSFAASWIAALPDLTFKQRLHAIQGIADDPNPGTREAVWIMMRPHIANDLENAFSFLQKWGQNESANIRRFAVEITRPRGVWCAHLTALRQNPKPGLALLESLNADPARYVQNSVANWLNDAGKDHPDWVRKVTQKWQKQNEKRRDESAQKASAYIIKRALRNL